ncbi:MAG: ATP-binding protein [Anaerolineales bacterium]|nr:ATP-binding protein [Anaerolineales bacterium]
MAEQNKNFTFEISLSVLNHLGRNLYRSFITILGEAISNSWDADAKNIWIEIDKEENILIIKDDGIGMSVEDFQNKFLKIGYSKRKDGEVQTIKGRPYIGRKGIGKLALLSCAEKISVISKIKGEINYIGGVIDNSELSQAITDDLTPQQYELDNVQYERIQKYTNGHEHGTIIYFENIKDGIKNSAEYLKKLLALYFRFSLIDKSFCLFVNKTPVTLDDLKELSEATQFLWIINKLDDPYINTLDKIKSDLINKELSLNVTGFVASVEKPRYLKITGTDEKVGIDLFVNGRLREKNILKRMPDYSTRHIASYLYGQIHFNELDSADKDRFTSSRDGVVPDDEKYNNLIKDIKKLLENISSEWDKLRLDIGEDGDDDNPRKTPKQRRARSLYNLSSQEYAGSKSDRVNKWLKDLQSDAEFNIPAYVDCFLSENLIRKFIEEQKISLSPEAENERNKWRNAELSDKGKANISVDIRRKNSDLSYLSMDALANLVDKVKEPQKDAGLSRDATEYKPMRNALAHTALLTDIAKARLTIVYENIQGRLKALLLSK